MINKSDPLTITVIVKMMDYGNASIMIPSHIADAFDLEDKSMVEVQIRKVVKVDDE